MVIKPNTTPQCPTCGSVMTKTVLEKVYCANCGDSWAAQKSAYIGMTVWVISPLSVFNGQCGVIESINRIGGMVRVSFPAPGKLKYTDLFHPAYLSETPPVNPKIEVSAPDNERWSTK